jgi:dolichol-phosphate mannosyltransferase
MDSSSLIGLQGPTGQVDVQSARPVAAPRSVAPREVSIVVPTFNELGNIEELIRRLEQLLGIEGWEIVFVDDDSPDRTADLVRRLAQDKPWVRVIHRIGRRGLSRAVVEGVMSTSSPLVAVMDADLQHDETLLTRMLNAFRAEPGLDLVVGSRYAEGGSTGSWVQDRQRMSRVATHLAKMVLRTELTDPMSGFFMVRRSAWDAAVRRLSGEGYKILLDLCASSHPPLSTRELPYTFRPRLAGESKLDSQVVLEYLLLLLDKRIGAYFSSRFLLFALVGGSGVLVHFAVLMPLLLFGAARFEVAQAVATVLAMTSNFTLNNVLTYRDRRLRGWKWLKGLLGFYAVCGLGALANVGIASALHGENFQWWLAATAGIAVGTGWNYLATASSIWRRRES